jgi:hypothetical protein
LCRVRNSFHTKKNTRYGIAIDKIDVHPVLDIAQTGDLRTDQIAASHPLRLTKHCVEQTCSRDKLYRRLLLNSAWSVPINRLFGRDHRETLGIIFAKPDFGKVPGSNLPRILGFSVTSFCIGSFSQTPFFCKQTATTVRSRHRMLVRSWKIRLVNGYTGTITGICFLWLAIGFALNEASFLARSSVALGTFAANLESQVSVPYQKTFCPQFQYVSDDGKVRTLTSSECSPPPISYADRRSTFTI